MMKDPAEWPDEELHGVRPGRAPRAGASVSCSRAVYRFPSSWMCSLTQKLSECLWGSLLRLHHVDVIDPELSLRPLSPSWEVGGVVLKIPSS